MKPNIHPDYKETKYICACGNEFTARSTKDEFHVEVCSKCHPVYTGKQVRTSHAGVVDKFNKKYGFENNNKTNE